MLAYSTVSQLGYMFLAAGVGRLHARRSSTSCTHAFFKALLFLGSGSVIHAMGGEQDMRQMGGLKKHLPVTYRTFLIGTLAIAGIPPLAGFFSKDEILAATFGAGGAYRLLWAVGLLTAGLTAFYMFRAVFLTFHGEFRGTARAGAPPARVAAGDDRAAGGAGGGRRDRRAGSGFRRRSRSARRTSTSSTTSWSRSIAEIHGHEAARPLGAGGRVGADPGLGRDRGRRHPARAPDLGRRPWGWRRARPGRDASRPCTGVLANKYYVDELYDATVVRGTWGLARLLSRFDAGVIDGLVNFSRHFTVVTALLSGFFDRYVVDGLVNLVGYVLSQSSRVFRRAADRSGLAVRPGAGGGRGGAGVRRRRSAPGSGR